MECSILGLASAGAAGLLQDSALDWRISWVEFAAQGRGCEILVLMQGHHAFIHPGGGLALEAVLMAPFAFFGQSISSLNTGLRCLKSCRLSAGAHPLNDPLHTKACTSLLQLFRTGCIP